MRIRVPKQPSPEPQTSTRKIERQRHALTLEGLEDVTAGRTVDHAEVVEWARRLLQGRRRR